MIKFSILFLFLLVLIKIYFKIADKFNIIDKPNHRSAHTEITLRGGGIIFWFVSLIYTIQNYKEAIYFFIGITIMSVISFWDDIKSLPNKMRLLAHFIAITIAFYSLNLFAILPLYGIIMAYILFIGIINAYNFMDGINGITGLYTIAVFASFWIVNQYYYPFINKDFLIYPIIASLVFLFFNYRKKAKCFAGDIGSIGIAFWIIYVLIQLMLMTKSFVWILFLAVYGIDTVSTILHRLYLRENIFEAHRHHYYQIVSNEYKIDHRLVALGYFVLQLVCSSVVIYFNKLNIWFLFLVILLPLILIYLTKFLLIKKLNANDRR